MHHTCEVYDQTCSDPKVTQPLTKLNNCQNKSFKFQVKSSVWLRGIEDERKELNFLHFLGNQTGVQLC